MSVARPRLAAIERRATVLESACRIFSKGSYRGTTTADIARESGVTEPILYRHFSSKRDLYLACLDHAWERMRSSWEAAIEAEPDPTNWMPSMARTFFEHKEQKVILSNLWIQALAEASEDPKIRTHLRRQLTEVHDFAAGVIRRCQESGCVPADRDADAEAWIFLSLSLLGAIGRRLGGLVEGEFERIRDSRRRWMTGKA